MAWRQARALEATGHHPRRRHLVVRADRSPAARALGRLTIRSCPGRHPDCALQRTRPAAGAGLHRAAVADPDGDRRSRPPGRGIPRRRALVARRQCVEHHYGNRRVVRLRDHQHDAHGDPGRRSRGIVFRLPGPGVAGEGRGAGHGPAWRGHLPDRWSCLSDPRGPRARGLRKHDGELDTERHPPTVSMGGAAPVDDVSQPARDPARQQRRDPGIPMVRARPPETDGFEQPRRRRRDGPSGLERRGAAVQRRRQYLQPRHRRRYTLIRHDGRPRRRLSRPRGQPRVPALLLQPDGLPALAHAVPR